MPTMIEIIVARAGLGKYRVMVGSMAITRPTRQSLLDGARALLGLGYPGQSAVVARHAGFDTVAMRGIIMGKLAEWTVKERDRSGIKRERWQPFHADFSSPVGSYSAEDVETGQLASETLAVLGKATR